MLNLKNLLVQDEWIIYSSYPVIGFLFEEFPVKGFLQVVTTKIKYLKNLVKFLLIKFRSLRKIYHEIFRGRGCEEFDWKIG